MSYSRVIHPALKASLRQGLEAGKHSRMSLELPGLERGESLSSVAELRDFRRVSLFAPSVNRQPTPRRSQ